MSIDIQQNAYTPKTYVLSSINIELLGAIHLLANSSHHEFAKEWVDLVYRGFTQESKDFLDIIAKLPLNGMGLYSLMLSKRDFNDVEGFLNRINETEDISFLCEVFETEEEKIIQIRKSEDELLKFIDDNYWVEEECREGIEYILHNTTTFRRSLVKILKELYSQHFLDKIESLEELYGHSINSINNQLKIKKPLDVAQELMGKTFYRVFPFKEYVFIPSYFISPHRLRTFTKDIQILIFDIRRDCLYLNEVAVEITNTLKVLSDRTRFEIIRQLLIGPTYGKVLAARLDLTTATISHHLEQLRAVSLINEEKIKNIKYFSVNKEELDKVLNQMNLYLNNKL